MVVPLSGAEEHLETNNLDSEIILVAETKSKVNALSINCSVLVVVAEETT